MKNQSNITVGAQGTQYGNWMSAPVMKMVYTVVAVLAVALILVAFLWKNTIAIVVVGLLFMSILAFPYICKELEIHFHLTRES